ncbi:uncharacterized protein LOC124182800 isoform X1 [Neodiprion fabricii]|uniref:uncharacterized protein LOC124182800 isoform X1 n=2 Tax=Neodiprion fabricii TaxID=2872261 RepID=UPI001ED9406B|nr:uncharacterized protein LOC124182800 isoform X1 [Neodiprion fabricii]
MSSSFTKFHPIFGFLGLLASVLVCPGVHPMESIVPERDLTPRNFNPHPYVSAAMGTAILSNFDHPYAAVASKRSGHVRNRSKTRDSDRVASITSLANFARDFLGLINGKKRQPVISDYPYNGAFKFPLEINERHAAESVGGYGIIGSAVQGNQNGGEIGVEKLAIGYYRDEDGDGTRRKLPTVKDAGLFLQGKLLFEEKLNFASVQQSPFNEESAALRDTNDNLSRGLYVTSDEEDHFQPGAPRASSDTSDVSDLRLVSLTRYDVVNPTCCSGSRQVSLTGYLGHEGWSVDQLQPLYGINTHPRPDYFLTSDPDYRHHSHRFDENQLFLTAVPSPRYSSYFPFHTPSRGNNRVM